MGAMVQGGSAAHDRGNEKGKVVQEMKIEAPAMTEEDHYGYNMPDQYKCDACKAAMYHLNEALITKHPKSRRLQEWEYQDIFDETCTEGFKGYGVKLVDGKNVLSGPGLRHDEHLQPGMGAIQMGGEKWEKRMGEMCRKIVYESIGEENIYEHFRAVGNLPQGLCEEATRMCQTGVQDQNRVKNQKKTKHSKNSGKQIKKEKKTKSKAKAAEEPARTEKPSNQGEALDLTSFLTQIAKDHDVPTSAYTQPRSRTEWERTILQMAGRLYSGKAVDEPVTQI